MTAGQSEDIYSSCCICVEVILDPISISQTLDISFLIYVLSDMISDIHMIYDRLDIYVYICGVGCRYGNRMLGRG